MKHIYLLTILLLLVLAGCTTHTTKQPTTQGTKPSGRTSEFVSIPLASVSPTMQK